MNQGTSLVTVSGQEPEFKWVHPFALLSFLPSPRPPAKATFLCPGHFKPIQLLAF
jgi:hypothetical protein